MKEKHFEKLTIIFALASAVSWVIIFLDYVKYLEIGMKDFLFLIAASFTVIFAGIVQIYNRKYSR